MQTSDDACAMAMFNSVKENVKKESAIPVIKSFIERCLSKRGNGRCAIAKRLGVPVAHSLGIPGAETLLLECYEACKLDTTPFNIISCDLMLSRPDFMYCACRMSRDAMRRSFGFASVDSAASVMLFPCATWPKDIMDDGVNLEKMAFQATMKFRRPFSGTYEDGTCGTDFEYLVLVSTAVSIMRMDIARGDIGYMAWDFFRLMTHSGATGMLGSCEAMDEFNSFVSSGALDGESDKTNIVGKSGYDISKAFYECASSIEPTNRNETYSPILDAIYKHVVSTTSTSAANVVELDAWPALRRTTTRDRVSSFMMKFAVHFANRSSRIASDLMPKDIVEDEMIDDFWLDMMEDMDGVGVSAEEAVEIELRSMDPNIDLTEGLFLGAC